VAVVAGRSFLTGLLLPGPPPPLQPPMLLTGVLIARGGGWGEDSKDKFISLINIYNKIRFSSFIGEQVPLLIVKIVDILAL
jgi:hypothetical protein